MKSYIILSSLLSLRVALASPVSPPDDPTTILLHHHHHNNKAVIRQEDQDPCICDYMCIAQVGPDCECERRSKKACYDAQIEAGLKCPEPTISERCQIFSILPIDPPTPTPVPAAGP